MSPLELLNAYLKRLESRLRLAALARGAAVVAGAALAATVVVVLATNWLAFSERSLMGGRIALFLAVAFAIGFGLALPLLALNRRKTARATELKVPEFNQRLLTLAERDRQGEQEPFLELLAADTLELAQAVEPGRVVGRSLVIGFVSAAAAALGVLLWLILGASGFLGYGARLLWAGPTRGEIQPFYDIVIDPGNKTVRRGANLAVTARLIGFQAPLVRLYAKYRDSAKWEEAPMVPREGGSAYEFLFAGIPQTVDYYASAGKLSSKTFTLIGDRCPQGETAARDLSLPGMDRSGRGGRGSGRRPARRGRHGSRGRGGDRSPLDQRPIGAGGWRPGHPGRRGGELAHRAGQDRKGWRLPHRRAGTERSRAAHRRLLH